MPNKNMFKKLSPFLVKNKRMFSAHKGPIVLIDATQKINSQRKLSSINHSIFDLSKTTVWVKVTRGSGLFVCANKFKGSRKIKVPSKRLLIMAKSDLKHFDNKYAPILTYTPSDEVIWSVLFRYKKMDQLHIDSPSSKIAGSCRLDGQRYVQADYAKKRKSIAKVNLSWIKKAKVEDLKCVWTKNFAELMTIMGLISP